MFTRLGQYMIDQKLCCTAIQLEFVDCGRKNNLLVYKRVLEKIGFIIFFAT